MHVVKLLPASILRAFFLMWVRLRGVFGDAPVLFFAVVIGVALTFRVAVGAIRDASIAPEVAPTFATGPEPGLAEANAKAEAEAKASADAKAKADANAIGEVGAAAKVQPIGMPARVAPKVRGHGRRPIRGERQSQ